MRAGGAACGLQQLRIVCTPVTTFAIAAIAVLAASCAGPEAESNLGDVDAGVTDSKDDDGEDEGDDSDLPSSAAGLTWKTDSSAADGRTFYGDRVGRTVFEVEFTTTVAGERRWVQGRANIEQSTSSSADPLMMAVAGVGCTPVAGGTTPINSISNTQNVIRGTPLRLAPQLLFIGGAPGAYRCVLSSQGGRPRPTGTFSATKFSIASGSYLRVSSPVPAGSDRSYAPKTRSDVLDDGEALDAAPLEWTAPAGVTSFRAIGAVKLTTCTSVGGSDDPYDNLPELCGLPEHELDRTVGSHARVVLTVGQYAEGGGYCAITRLPASSATAPAYIDKDSHHEMVYRSLAAVPVSTAATCTRRFRIKTYVVQTAGPSLIVHKQGTINFVIPN
ncbi:MAG: hypothetical protein M3680_34905 [Myxococcota bacterium]|nr:hypothetical protein [Myxococcota bacterium]